ncbi:MAG TPA: hypothetical protein VFC34_13075, partial [Puia sp.]|nr:hypothetical protein [Puia sp.]
YNLLRKKMGEQETYELVEFIHSEVKAELDSRTNVFLTKEDLRAELDSRTNIFPTKEYLRTELKYLRTELDSKTREFLTKNDKIELIDRINKVRSEVTKVKTELIVWVVSVGVLQYLLLMLTKKFF